MKAVLCPVCNGKGTLPEYEIGKEDIDEKGTIKIYRLKDCYGCGGKGWVEVSESDYNPIRELKWEYHYPGVTITVPQDNISKCPSCGGDRNDPPLTGCPKGSHYGTYCLSGGSDAQN